jgi:hypothetical protein
MILKTIENKISVNTLLVLYFGKKGLTIEFKMINNEFILWEFETIERVEFAYQNILANLQIMEI